MKTLTKQAGNSNGIGIFGLLFVILFTLKITGIDPVASWSWWWVTAPLWGGFLISLVIIGIAFAIYLYMEKKDDQ